MLKSLVIKHNEVKATWNKEQLEQYFHESKHDPSYAGNYRKVMKEFRKDEKMRKATIMNDGKRLSAGCDWWRIRPVWRIYYNGIFVELALLCPWEFGRKLLYFCMGQNLFGRNIKLGKNVLFDHIYGDMVKVGKNVVIEDGVMLDGHEFTTAEGMAGKAIIEDGVILRKNSWVRAGITIGKGAVLEENAGAMKDIGPGEVWAGSPAKKVEKAV